MLNTIEVMKMRLEYFQDKKIFELSDSEIREFMKLRRAYIEEFTDLKEHVKSVWDSVVAYQEELNKY